MSSLRNIIPVGSQTLTPAAEIIATLNVSTGEYEFSAVPVELLKLDASSMYFMEQISIAANIDQSDFFNGVTQSVKVRFVSQKTGQRHQHFSEDFTVVSIQEPIPLSNVFYSLDGGDSLKISISGAIAQQVGMIDKDTVVFRVSAVIHRTGNQNFVNDLKRTWGQ